MRKVDPAFFHALTCIPTHSVRVDGARTVILDGLSVVAVCERRNRRTVHLASLRSTSAHRSM